MNRKRILLLSSIAAILLSGTIAWAGNIGNTIYGIYSETYAGMKIGAPYGDSDAARLGQWNDPVLDGKAGSAAEGNACLQVNTGSGSGAVFFEFGDDKWAYDPVPHDMTAYAGGSINFMLKSDTAITVKIVGQCGYAEKSVSSTGNSWKFISLSLSDFSAASFSTILQPAVFVPTNGGAHEFYIDNLFWSKATQGTFIATLRNVSDNSVASPEELTWDNSKITLGQTNWLCANQYIELCLNSYYAGWGIQIYTDNKNTSASPRYTGTGAAAGLIDTSSTTKNLPMCWRIVDVTTNTYTIQQSASGYPDRLWAKELGSDYPCFFWMMDKSDSKFRSATDPDAFDYCTVWDNRGIHHAEGSSWGGAVSPNYIYLGAKFASAVTPRIYKTGKLIVELFND